MIAYFFTSTLKQHTMSQVDIQNMQNHKKMACHLGEKPFKWSESHIALLLGHIPVDGSASVLLNHTQPTKRGFSFSCFSFLSASNSSCRNFSLAFIVSGDWNLNAFLKMLRYLDNKLPYKPFSIFNNVKILTRGLYIDQVNFNLWLLILTRDMYS